MDKKLFQKFTTDKRRSTQIWKGFLSKVILHPIYLCLHLPLRAVQGSVVKKIIRYSRYLFQTSKPCLKMDNYSSFATAYTCALGTIFSSGSPFFARHSMHRLPKLSAET